jgi:hypothetical protein
MSFLRWRALAPTTVVLLACAACGADDIEVSDAAMAVVAKNPLGDLEKPAQGDERFAGRIADIERAGSYTYASIVDDRGNARWVVTMRRGLAVGDQVEVKNMGLQRAFRSKRLDRTFDDLVFGVVRPKHTI